MGKRYLSKHFRIQRTDRYLRLKLWRLNIYFSLKPLATRNKTIYGEKREKRIKLKRKLLSMTDRCQICGRQVTWGSASIHHIIPVHDDPQRAFDLDNVQVLCCRCHARIHEIEALEAQAIYQSIS